MMLQAGEAHEARKRLLAKAVRAGKVALSEVDRVMGQIGLDESERALFYFCLRVTGVRLLRDSAARASL